MPNGEQQEYNIKLGGQTYKFRADPGLSQEAAVDYANKKYPTFAEAYSKRYPGASHAAPTGVSHFPGTDIPQSPSRIPASMTGHPEEGLQKSDIPEHAAMATATLGGGMFEAVPGVAGILARMAGAGVGGGVGHAGGTVAAGEKPSLKESAKTGAGYSVAELLPEVSRIPGLTKRVGAKIGAAEKAAADQVVHIHGVTDLIDRALELSERGHGQASAIKKLKGAIDAAPRIDTAEGAKPFLGFQEARDFYSALAEDLESSSGKMKSAMANVKHELGERIIESAERMQPGKGKEFRQLLKSYSQATSVTKKAKIALDIAWKAALAGAVGGAAGEMAYKAMK